MFAHFPDGLPDQRAASYLHGWRVGLVVGDYIGLRDSDDIRDILPCIPPWVMEPIPYGHDDVLHPEVDALKDGTLPPGAWFQDWMGLKDEQYYFVRDGKLIPELEVQCWLGYLRGSLETGRIDKDKYDLLRALLPPFNDDFTPLIAATIGAGS